ncbi:hypothetical protein BJ742DRAFT_266686 [Cladochytrium replicatum]|nr:hypothetical protein BJ742DRAFT_266686 [Cladochytrium replicatum]
MSDTRIANMASAGANLFHAKQVTATGTTSLVSQLSSSMLMETDLYNLQTWINRCTAVYFIWGFRNTGQFANTYASRQVFGRSVQQRTAIKVDDAARMDILLRTPSNPGASVLGGTGTRKSSVKHIHVESPAFASPTGATPSLQSPSSPSYPSSYSRGY